MRKKFSICIISNYGTPIKQITASKRLLQIMGIATAGLFLVLAVVLLDYTNLRTISFNTQLLESEVYGQKEEINTQRRQIQAFAETINALKSKLVVLEKTEKKLNALASIDQSGINVKVKAKVKGKVKIEASGIGGSLPEDIDITVDLKQRHDTLVREMHDQVKQLNVAAARQYKDFDSLLVYFKERQNLLAGTPSINPTGGRFTSGFGRRTSPFTGKSEFHRGLDIGGKRGAPIVAPADGIVTFVGRKGYLGRVIVIDHGHGIVTRYGHSQEALKKRGDSVKRGDKVALVGSTGRTTGPHLHYEVHLNGLPVNPKKYITN